MRLLLAFIQRLHISGLVGKVVRRVALSKSEILSTSEWSRFLADFFLEVSARASQEMSGYPPNQEETRKCR